MKNKILCIVFCLFIWIVLIANVVTKDKELSTIERRKLAQAPELTLDNVIYGNYFDEFESYSLDQFIFRDNLRNIKSLAEFNIFQKLDDNNLYVKDGYIFKIEYPLKEDKVVKFTDKINAIYDNYLSHMNVYYSIIPDKNYYSKDSYLKMDYDKLISIVNGNMVSNMKYIDITDSLSLEDYYYTDIHWKQEGLSKVVDKLSTNMNFKVGSNYKEHYYEPFYGTYYGQIGLKVKADKITYLSNETINSATVNDYESYLETVYEEESLGKKDSYDVFVGGATALTEITVPNSTSHKELIIFRDSFGSSIAPLLLDGYSKITLVDLRYMSNTLLSQYIEFNNQDVLFLYNTTIINNSDMIK